MSDEEFYDDEDDYLFLDDISYNEAVGRSHSSFSYSSFSYRFANGFLQDDLAEHTMHSPVLVNYDPAFETASLASDWEYHSDDFWDHDTPPKKRQRKVKSLEGMSDKEKVIEYGTARKRRRLQATDNLPSLSLGEPIIAAPIVIWKAKGGELELDEGTAPDHEHGEKVSLLKDWRQRLKCPPKASDSQFKTMNMHRNGNQRATAVLIDSTGPKPYHHSTPLTTTLSKARGLPSRARISQSTLGSTPPGLNSISSGGSLLENTSHRSERDHLADDVASNGRKRKAKDEAIADTADAPRWKKRLGRPKKQEAINMEEPTKTWASMGKENTSGRTNKTSPLRQKRKMVKSDDEPDGQSAKRCRTSRKAAEESAMTESRNTSTRESTRKKRV